jgi:hypothetical protein
MGYRVSDRRSFTAAMAVAALIINVPTVTSQPIQQQTRILSGIEEAAKAIGDLPRLKKMPPQARRRLVEFVMGNTLFALAHEIGHGLISEMNMPVLGREEAAADSFAVVNALKMASVFTEQVLIQAAKGWVLAAKRDKTQGNPLAFHDEHGLDLQRAYTVVCFMVGSNPEKYKALAADTKLPKERQTSCVVEWKNSAWSWDEMLKPHLRSADQPKVTITAEYQNEDKYPIQSRVLRHLGLLEAFAANAAERYAWPRSFSIVARSCGEANARWSSRARTLTLCYELIDEFMELFLGSSRSARKHRSTR